MLPSVGMNGFFRYFMEWLSFLNFYSLCTMFVNWTSITCSEDVLSVFWTSYVHPIYVLCQEDEAGINKWPTDLSNVQTFTFLRSWRCALRSEAISGNSENTFGVILKARFVLKIFRFRPIFFDHAEKRLDYKAKISYKIYDVANWITSNYNTYTVQYLKKWRQSDNEIWSFNRIQHEKNFPEKSYTKCG